MYLMALRSPHARRWGGLLALTALAITTAPHRGLVRAAQAPLLVQVRTALAHGDVSDARRLTTGAAGAEGQLAGALVDMFVGQDDAARQRLTPLAEANPLGEAALELGLLDLRRGRREEADRRLQPLAAQRDFAGPDDYYRLARAAAGVREFLLANDAYQRTIEVPRADIQTSWGDMLVVRHEYALAGQAYRDALAADPAWVPAYVGLARALLIDDRGAAEAQLEAARQVAPGHPDVLLLSAEMALDRDEVDVAGERLDEFAGVRPGTVEEAALRVAVAYEDGGEAAVETALAAVAAANPRSALGYRRGADRASNNFQFDAAARLARRGTELDPDDPYVHFDLGLYLLRTGDEAAARTALERSWELDESSRVTKNTLDLLDMLDTFTVVDTGRMIFKFHPAQAAVLEPYAIPLAEQAYDEFSARYGMTPSEPILIEVFSEHDDFAVRTLGLPGLEGALGACFGRVVTMDSPAARPPGQFSWHATLWHEMAHVFSLQLSAYHVPRWLTEGISSYEEHRRHPGWGRELTLEFARLLSQERTFGVKGLPEAFTRPESLAIAYFEASLVVEHLVEQNGEAGLRALLLAYADGADDLDAFATAFGQSVDEVDASFARFVQARYGELATAMAEPPSAAAPDDLTALRSRAEAAPGNFESQVTLGRALFQAQQFDAAVPVLERAASLAPPARGSGSPRALLAAIAEAQGDVPRARAELRQLLEHDHENVEAARKLADLSVESPDDLEHALRALAELDPIRERDVHGRLGRLLLAQEAYREALVEFEVALAVGPANVAEAHTDVAEALLRLGRRDEAKDAAIEALKEAPAFARAQDLLLEAIGRRP
jgi:tetratricopeptide (TPR) repeat protein